MLVPTIGQLIISSLDVSSNSCLWKRVRKICPCRIGSVELVEGYIRVMYMHVHSQCESVSMQVHLYKFSGPSVFLVIKMNRLRNQ